MIICRSKAIMLASLMALAGCLGTEELSFAPLNGAKPPASAKALSQVPLANGAFVLKAPEGWCIEPRSLRNTARRSFALLAGCHDMTDGKVGAPSPAGYISVSIGAQTDGLDGSAALLDAVLGDQKPKARNVTNGVSKAQLSAPEDGAAPVWRVAALQSERPILITVTASDDSDLAGPFGGRIAEKIAQSIVANSVVREMVAK